VDDPVIRQLCKESFGEFFDKQIGYYEKGSYEAVNLVGSVAFHFKAIIEEVAEEKGIRLGTIVGSPMPKLIEFYSSTNKQVNE
jgi:hypothetical protein